MKFSNNIFDTALIIEGGGMRASYTAGFIVTLLENELYFNYVTGVSAGASHAMNYLSRDIERTKKSFVDFVLEPDFGGWKSFLQGNGYFCSQYIYEQAPFPDSSLPFDYNSFQANPAQFRIGACDRDSGELIYFRNEDVDDLVDLVKIVRASSSLPVFMQATDYKQRVFVDGGLCCGIPFDIAKKDGWQKFFVIMSHPRGYRKNPLRAKPFIKAYYAKHPQVFDILNNRCRIYNQTIDELEILAEQGQAYLVYPEDAFVSTFETNYQKLAKSYALGYKQGQRELPNWKEFIFR